MLAYELSDQLFTMGAIKFGNFPIKNGNFSPLQIDLRSVLSFPDLLNNFAEKLIFKTNLFSFDLICAVPYTAVPIATAFSLKSKTPLVLRRREPKPVSQLKKIEGFFEEGQKCLILEEVVTSGISVLETIKSLEEVGIIVEDVITLIDREQGGTEHLKKHGYRLHSLYTLGEILDQLTLSNKIEVEKAQEIKAYIKKNPFHES